MRVGSQPNFTHHWSVFCRLSGLLTTVTFFQSGILDVEGANLQRPRDLRRAMCKEQPVEGMTYDRLAFHVMRQDFGNTPAHRPRKSEMASCVRCALACALNTARFFTRALVFSLGTGHVQVLAPVIFKVALAVRLLLSIWGTLCRLLFCACVYQDGLRLVHLEFAKIRMLDLRSKARLVRAGAHFDFVAWSRAWSLVVSKV